MERNFDSLGESTMTRLSTMENLQIIDEFRTEALSLLEMKTFYKNQIKELSATVEEGSIELGEYTDDLQPRIDELEKKITSATVALSCKEMMLKFAQISYKLNDHIGWEANSTATQSDTENTNILRQFERVYLAQTNYLKLREEVVNLEKIMRLKQQESFEAILKARSLQSELENLKEKAKERETQLKSEQAKTLKDLLSKGIRTHTITRRLLSDLICCSQSNWYADRHLRQFVLKLDKKLEFE